MSGSSPPSAFLCNALIDRNISMSWRWLAPGEIYVLRDVSRWLWHQAIEYDQYAVILCFSPFLVAYHYCILFLRFPGYLFSDNIPPPIFLRVCTLCFCCRRHTANMSLISPTSCVFVSWYKQFVHVSVKIFSLWHSGVLACLTVPKAIPSRLATRNFPLLSPASCPVITVFAIPPHSFLSNFFASSPV